MAVSNTSRMAYLMGECRREMNGAVVGSMRYYGAEYGLNYGVSLPTVRSIAKEQGVDHDFARYLYQQQVRELQLCALWMADADAVTETELDLWAKGVINSEIAEEASFALLSRVKGVAKWLDIDNPVLNYCAFLSLNKGGDFSLKDIERQIISAVSKDIVILNSAIVSLLESSYRDVDSREDVQKILDSLPSNRAAEYIREEMSWRVECYQE